MTKFLPTKDLLDFDKVFLRAMTPEDFAVRVELQRQRNIVVDKANNKIIADLSDESLLLGGKDD